MSLMTAIPAPAGRWTLAFTAVAIADIGIFNASPTAPLRVRIGSAATANDDINSAASLLNPGDRQILSGIDSGDLVYVCPVGPIGGGAVVWTGIKRLSLEAGDLSLAASAQANAAAPSLVEGTENPLSSDLAGNLRTKDAAAGTKLDTLHSDLGTLHTDLQQNHTDEVQLHTDIAATLHADLAAVLAKMPAAPNWLSSLARSHCHSSLCPRRWGYCGDARWHGHGCGAQRR
jgi:hypothetical protein